MNESKEAFKSVRKRDWGFVLVALGFSIISFIVFLITMNPVILIIACGSVFLGILHLAWASKPKK